VTRRPSPTREDSSTRLVLAIRNVTSGSTAFGGEEIAVVKHICGRKINKGMATRQLGITTIAAHVDSPSAQLLAIDRSTLDRLVTPVQFRVAYCTYGASRLQYGKDWRSMGAECAATPQNAQHSATSCRRIFRICGCPTNWTLLREYFADSANTVEDN
jgi:hypothetical protein